MFENVNKRTFLMFAKLAAFVQLLLLAAIFGFFYSYSVTTMWGLDLASGKAAMEAMQGINIAVRNPAFAPAFSAPSPLA